jgi:hypothetical protein
MLALLAALAVAAADPPGVRPVPLPPPPRSRVAAADDPDPELLRHLDELEKLELLRVLEALEPADGPPGTGHDPAPRSDQR